MNAARIPAEVPRFALPPLTIPIAADALQRWADAAQAGDRIAYAHGPEPWRGHATFVLAGALAAAGMVTLFQPRRPGSAIFDFIAERRAADVPPHAIETQLRATLDPEEDRVFALLRNLAAIGHSCPTDEAIAKRLGLSGADAASYRMRKLRAAGLIRVENRGPLKPRVVTIVADGRQTAKGR